MEKMEIIKKLSLEDNEEKRPDAENIYSVPEGYFSKLENRLMDIPQEETAVMTVSFWSRVKPYVALAACFALLITAGKTVFSYMSDPAEEDTRSIGLESYQQYYYADMIPVTYDWTDGIPYEEDMSLSEDEIIEYMIESGISLDMLDIYDNE